MIILTWPNLNFFFLFQECIGFQSALLYKFCGCYIFKKNNCFHKIVVCMAFNFGLILFHTFLSSNCHQNCQVPDKSGSTKTSQYLGFTRFKVVWVFHSAVTHTESSVCSAILIWHLQSSGLLKRVLRSKSKWDSMLYPSSRTKPWSYRVAILVAVSSLAVLTSPTRMPCVYIDVTSGGAVGGQNGIDAG